MSDSRPPAFASDNKDRLPEASLAQLPLPLAAEQIAALEAAYATPSRAYHNIGHVAEVLRHYADVAADTGWTQPREVALAVLYHDAIYQAGRRDNEARSALLAREHIARWLPEQGIDADRVAELIELTARHGAIARDDVDEQTRLFLDGDMAILGAEPAVFDAYDRGIASEYRGHVPGPLFKLNRRRFLKGLLKRERIFLSDLFHQRYDAAARNNLRRAITTKR
ncbi:HD domain-containing protein [Pseudomonas sp. CGJS7]|uniref:HD domain-containing protein n=1 Tax=Pseudomonas sp. CGJS7 TaxID=3109348 RepID=UPI00300967C6